MLVKTNRYMKMHGETIKINVYQLHDNATSINVQQDATLHSLFYI